MSTPKIPLLDTPYCVNSNLVTRIAGPDELHVLGIATPITISLAMLSVISAFAEARTVRDVYPTLDVDVSIEDFGAIIDGFAARGVLTAQAGDAASAHATASANDGPSLGDALNACIFSNEATVTKIGQWLRGGRAVVIQDALPSALAERVFRELDESRSFRAIEGGHDFFHYRNSSIEDLTDHSPAVTEASALFGSSASRAFMARLSGQACSGPTATRASWYRPSEYALPHEDSSKQVARSVAYIWYLAKDWRQEWGGGLFWCPTGQYVKPGFNTLMLFNVSAINFHMVCPVSLDATSKRLSLNGFYCEEAKAEPKPPLKQDAMVSPWAYGPSELENPDPASVLVL